MKIEMYQMECLVASEIVKFEYYESFEKRVEEHLDLVENTMKAMEAVHGKADYFILTAQSVINNINYVPIKRKLYDVPEETPPKEIKPFVRPEAKYSNRQYNQAS